MITGKRPRVTDVEGRIFSSIIFLRVVNKGKRVIKNVTLAVKESQYIIPSISEVPIDVQGGQRVSVHAPLRQLLEPRSR